jgi:hypothetical protein
MRSPFMLTHHLFPILLWPYCVLHDRVVPLVLFFVLTEVCAGLTSRIGVHVPHVPHALATMSMSSRVAMHTAARRGMSILAQPHARHEHPRMAARQGMSILARRRNAQRTACSTCTARVQHAHPCTLS